MDREDKKYVDAGLLGMEQKLAEDLERITSEDEAWLENKIKEHDYSIVSKRDYGHYGPNFDQQLDVHYQIISNKGNKLVKDLDADYDWLSGVLDEFEDMTGSPCTINMGLQDDRFISAGFDCRAIYYKPGEDRVVTKPDKLVFKNGKAADDETKAQLKDIANKFGLEADGIENFLPLDKPKRESLGEDPELLSFENTLKNLGIRAANLRNNNLFKGEDGKFIITSNSEKQISRWEDKLKEAGFEVEHVFIKGAAGNAIFITPKKEIAEGKLKDLDILSYKYLVDVYDRENNHLARKCFMTRPQADAFIDTYMDILYDEKIEKDELVELENGKDFIGTLIKVIVEPKKDESLDENLSHSQNRLLKNLLKEFNLPYKKNTVYKFGIISAEDSGRHLSNEFSNNNYIEIQKKFGNLSKPKAIDITGYFEGSKEASKIIYNCSEKDLKNMGLGLLQDEVIYMIFDTSKDNDLGFTANRWGHGIKNNFDHYDLLAKSSAVNINNISSSDNRSELSNGFKFQLKLYEALKEDIEKHDTLNPKLFDENGKLKSEVREKILEIVKEFTDGLKEDGIKINVKDIKLVGSNVSYNYTKDSDLDVHIVADTDSLECPDDLYPLLYSAYRSLWNNKMDIEFYGIPVELYIETSDTQVDEIQNQEEK